MTRGQFGWSLLVAAMSGPLLAGLLLLIPLGVLTGVSVALDPSLGMYEFVPEEELILPFVLLALLISAANVRLTIVMSRDEKAGRIFEVSTDRYESDPSGAENPHGHRGKQFAEDFIRYLAQREGSALEIGEVDGEDYGWGFSIGEKEYSPLWVAFAHAGQTSDEKEDNFIIAVTLEPPLAPWSRLVYKPDFALRDRIEGLLADFLASLGLAYMTEAEDWVDPEPKSQPAARF